VPFIGFAQKPPSEYKEIIDIINMIDNEITLKQNQLKIYIMSKSKDSENQSQFEADKQYIDRIYSEIYSENDQNKLEFDSTFLVLTDEINALRSKRIYNQSLVFESEDINLNFIDDNYDANTSIWKINGSYYTKEFNNNQEIHLIDWFNLEITPIHAEILFRNKEELIIKGKFSIKYGNICLIGVQVYDPISRISLYCEFPEIRYKSILPSKQQRKFHRKFHRRDSFYFVTSYPFQFKTCQFSHNDKFLVMGGEKNLLLFNLELDSYDTIYYNYEYEVYFLPRNIHGTELDGDPDDTYYNNNINQWNIQGSKLHKKFRRPSLPNKANIIDFQISPNDSMVVFILKEDISRGRNHRPYQFLVVYKIYEDKYMYYMPWDDYHSSGRNEISLDNISFPFQENNHFYITNSNSEYELRGRYWDHVKTERTIDKLNILNYSIERTNQYSNISSDLYNNNNINISYDNKFFLIESNEDRDRDTIKRYVYNIGKGIIPNYILPASYYRMFPTWKNKFSFVLPELNDQNKKLDIPCPSCRRNYDYLRIDESNNTFVCDYYRCESSFAIINDKFYRLENYTFSSNKGLIAILGDYSMNIFFSLENACDSYGAFLDKCGNCVGGNTNLDPCKKDCNGVFGGESFIDDCGICSGGTTNIIANSNKDSCGICFGDNSTCSDCNHVINGTAYRDKCGNCVGGNTNLDPCEKDCNGDYGGKSYIDDCNRCVGGSTKLKSCRKRYFPNGSLRSVLHEDINNKLIFEQQFYENGYLKNEISDDIDKYEKYYDNEGNLDGTITHWYSNMQIKSKRKYSNGELTKGTHKEFFANGQISKKIVIYVKSGMVTIYNERGKKIQRFKCNFQGNRLN